MRSRLGRLADNDAAYSASQQLITSAWNVVFAVALASCSSYDQAKAKSEELRERRRARGSAPQAGG
jgi:hypothetical protein